MRIFRRLVVVSLLTCLGGCGRSVSKSPPPLSQPSPALPDSFAVSGTLVETVDGVSRRLAARQVRLFGIHVESCGAGCVNEKEREDTFITDDNGQYTARVPSKSRVFAYARDVSAPWQPCLASAVVDKDTTIDVHVTPVGSSLTPPAAASPMITGFVYETTPQGRRPLPGVVAWLEVSVSSFLVAVTRTDESGRFFLCRVNAPVLMGVSSRDEWLKAVPGTADLNFEIELRR
jgi:hypothetical protein